MKLVYFAMALIASPIACSDWKTLVVGEKDKNTEQLSNSDSVGLGKLSEEPQEHGKLKGFRVESLDSIPAEKEIAAIIKVSKEGYLPLGITPSAQISPYLFTTRLRPADIRRLESDPAVTSIELTQKLQSLED